MENVCTSFLYYQKVGRKKQDRLLKILEMWFKRYGDHLPIEIAEGKKQKLWLIASYAS